MITKDFKKPTTLVIALLALVALLAILGSSSRGLANPGETKPVFVFTNPTSVSHTNDRFAALNSKSQLASSGDETAVRNLAHEVFTQFGSADMNDALAVVNDRIVISEINYRREGRGGVSEGRLVNSLNKLTKQLGAPDFARVSVAQVRYLRVNLLAVCPSLIGDSGERRRGRSIIKTDMSPLEATALSLMLITQKLWNKDFQVTPREWDRNSYQKQVAKWKAFQSGRPAALRQKLKATEATESAKSKELRQAFTNHASDIGALVDSALTEIGILAEGVAKR